MNYKEKIRSIEDIFFDKKNPRYADVSLFSEIFDILDNTDFKEKQPELYEAELKRIRDLHNVFTTAYEEGIEKGKRKVEMKEKKI